MPEGDPLGSSNYQGACRTHDACYGQCGESQSDCDWNLGQDMQNECAAQGESCNVAGLAYSAAVFSRGGDAYRKAQADCVCGSE